MESKYNYLLDTIRNITKPIIVDDKIFIDPIRYSEISRIVKKLLDNYRKLKVESEQIDFSDISDLIDKLDTVIIEELLINTKIKKHEAH